MCVCGIEVIKVASHCWVGREGRREERREARRERWLPNLSAYKSFTHA